mgnify:CR=1 FL=1
MGGRKIHLPRRRPPSGAYGEQPRDRAAESRQRQIVSAAQLDYQAIAAKSSPAVVFIAVQLPSGKKVSGSGFNVLPSGLVVTNKHVVQDETGGAAVRIAVEFDKTKAAFVKGFKDLFDPRLKGRVSLLTEMRDTMGLALLANGDDPAKVDRPSFDRAIALIQPNVASGQIRQFTGNDYSPLLAKGDVLAAFAWSGDVVQLKIDNPNIQFSVPQAGGIIGAAGRTLAN